MVGNNDKTRKNLLTGQQLGAIELNKIPQIGSARARLLKKLGITTLFDLLYYLPRRYEDRNVKNSLANIRSGEIVTFKGMIEKVEELTSRKGVSLLRVNLANDSETVTAIWFNQSFLKKSLRPGSVLTVTGKLERNLFNAEISVIDYEVGNNKTPIHVGRIVPIYGATEELSQRTLRRIMYHCICTYSAYVKDIIPLDLRETLQLLPLPDALYQIHFPSNCELLKKARERLIFDELFLFQLGLLRTKNLIQKQGIRRVPRTNLPQIFLKSLPFSLTKSQLRVIEEIEKDLSSENRMYRLLQGDVGSGKTLVAIYALLYVVASGFQGVFMAPTEVLAEQHYLALQRFTRHLNINVALLTGSLSKRERESILQQIRSGEVQIIIGTHALLEDEVLFSNVGLIVIDEQHRFGVEQREILLSKAEKADVLVMTATPIPRSLTLTVYGDLNLSVIDEFPEGRKGIKTYFLPAYEKERVYQFLRKELDEGRQAYVVCPLIEESEKLDVEAVTKRALELTSIFPQYQVGVLHGKLRMDEKEKVMDAFRKGNIHILVSTTVIEVGIDVPNASVMIIEGAERFGLAQLHQLRGRVGRGSHQGYCILIGNPKTEEARERIKILVKHQDGFQVAERDLYLRGPGELMGTRQHGFSDFRVVNIFRDTYQLENIRCLAYKYQNRISSELFCEINFRFPSLLQGLKI